MGHEALEDWMAVCRFNAEQSKDLGPPCPTEIVALAERCDEMRRRSVLPGGLQVSDWSSHVDTMKSKLLELGIAATLTDGEMPRSSQTSR